MSHFSDSYFYLIAGFCFGVYGFFWGFMRLRRKRRIENIPTSTVRGMAMGLVELTGRAHKEPLLVSPLSRQQCVYYRYKVQRYERHGKSSRWVTISQGDSSKIPFWLTDDTGKVLILPDHAEFECTVRYKYDSGWGKPIPDGLKAFLEKHRLRYKALIGSYAMRFREWYIKEGDTAYILGTAAKNTQLVAERQRQLTARLQALKENKEKMAEIDLNKDGVISDEEWQLAAAGVEQQLLEEETQRLGTLNADVVITQGDADKLFIISDRGEKGLVIRLTQQACLGILGGTALALICLGVLLFLFFNQ